MNNLKPLMRLLIKNINKISKKFVNIEILFRSAKKLQINSKTILDKSLREVIFSKNKYQTFKDENGQIFNVIPGLRDFLKPYWRSMFQPPSYTLPEEERVHQLFNNALNSAKNALKTLSLFDIEVKNAKAIEIGCDDGSKSVALRYLGVREVIGSDVIEYFANSSIKHIGIDKLEENFRKYLYNLRMKFINNYFPLTPIKKVDPDYNIKNINNLSFVYDDITNSKLPSEEFDLVFSWECLEHFIDPKKAVLNISRILKTGGYAYHRYNPFFALNGGHSLCTLDIPWGHALLSEKGFLKYIREFRLNELELSKNFYLKCLNRMTLKDLKEYAREANLETMLLLPSPNPEHLDILDLQTLIRVKGHYSSVDILELISPWITIIHKKI